MKAEQLRKSILQLAIQGKLVKQDPNDEPASVLLERIREEKQKLIKEGKIKKDKKADSIIFKGDDNCHYEKVGSEVKNIEDEIPFEIPDTWCWVRFPQLVYFELGKTPDRHTDKFWNKGIYPWFSIADMQDKKTITETKDKISEVALQEKFNGSLSPKGTLLMSFKLTVGRTSILGVDAVHNEAIISIFPYVCDSNIIRNYLMNTLGLLVNYVEQTDAIKGATLNSSKLKSMFIPVPPLAEQERIISHIKQFEPFLVEYDNLEQQATKLDTEIYDKLKKSILQYAIQGKLVEQDENDEPASVLLERIRAEKKAQLGKKYVESYIYKGDDNCYYEKVGKNEPVLVKDLPFDIPDSWSWARLKDVVEINPRNSVDDGTMVSFVEMKSLKDGFNNSFVYEKRAWKAVKSGFTHFQNGDVGLAKITPCFQNRKSAIFYELENGYGAGTTELHILRPHKNTMLADYLLWFVKSPYLIEYGKQKFSGTAGQQRFGTDEVKNTLIPIPPQAEQERICLKIKEILNRIEKDES
jgi:type I restriction enzyme S subunit